MKLKLSPTGSHNPEQYLELLTFQTLARLAEFVDVVGGRILEVFDEISQNISRIEKFLESYFISSFFFSLSFQYPPKSGASTKRLAQAISTSVGIRQKLNFAAMLKCSNLYAIPRRSCCAVPSITHIVTASRDPIPWSSSQRASQRSPSPWFFLGWWYRWTSQLSSVRPSNRCENIERQYFVW